MKMNYKQLRNEVDYWKVVLATFITRIGDGIDMVAFSWLVYEITGSTMLVATIAAVNMIPTILIGFIGGVLCNYIDEKKILWICDVGRGLCVGTISLLYFMGSLEVWHLFVITFLNSSFEGFRSPAQTSVFPKILKEENMDHGMALYEMFTQAGNLLGLCVAPICISLFNLGGALLIDTATFVLCACIIVCMKKVERTRQESAEGISFGKEFKEGFLYLAKDRLMVHIGIIVLIINALFVPLNIFQAAYIKDYMQMGSEGISIMSVSMVVAMMISAPFIPVLKEKLKFRFLFLTGGITMSLCFALYGGLSYIPDIAYRYLALIVMAIVFGIANNMVNVPFRIFFVKHIDQQYIGIVSAVVGATSMGIQPLASMIFGVLSNYFTLDIIYFASGSIILVIFLLQLFNKVLRGLNEY